MTRRATTKNSGNGKRPTLRTIAEITGLSMSTVSLSLRGGAALKEETRRKVAEVAKELGYVPDRAGVRLRTGKTNVIALVLDGGEDAIDFARHMIAGIGQAIRQTRYHLTVTPEFDGNRSVESIRYILDNRTADGVIITHTSPHDRRVQMLMEADFPFVSHGRTEFFSPHAYHDFHGEAFAERAVERLAELGCKDILLALGSANTTNYHNILAAFRQTCTRLGASGRVIECSMPSGHMQDLRQMGRDLAASPDRPQGIICDGELQAIALFGGIAEQGLRLGRDIKVVSKQTSEMLPIFFPQVETIEEDVFAAGVELTRLLLRRIDGEPPENLRTLSEPILHWH